MKNYATRNKEKLAKYRKEWYLKIKEDPERYKTYLERQREYSSRRYEELSKDTTAYEEYLTKQREYKKRYREKNAEQLVESTN